MQNNLTIPQVYGEIYIDKNNLYKTTGVHRTGCIFCAYGAHREKYPNRFQKLQSTHPQLYDYCMNNLDFKTVLSLLKIEYKQKTCNENMQKINFTVNKTLFLQIQKLNWKINNSEIINTLIENEWIRIDKRKKCNPITINPILGPSIHIEVRINHAKLDKLNTYLQINNADLLINYLMSKELENVEFITQ